MNHGYSVLPESPFVGKTIEGRVLLASEESRRIFAKANKAAIYLNELVRRNQLDRASAYVNELRREHLDISEGYFVDPLIDLEFLKGRFGGAEEILEKTFQWNRDGYELLFLKLSLCLAKRGIVYEDQADYCRKSSVERLQWIFDTPFNLKEL